MRTRSDEEQSFREWIEGTAETTSDDWANLQTRIEIGCQLIRIAEVLEKLWKEGGINTWEPNLD